MKRAPCSQPIGLAVAMLFGGAFGLISPASAQTIGSSYTSTAPKDCRVTSAGTEVDDSTIRICPGKAGLVVLISEDDLRETVSVGRNRAAAAREPAAQSLVRSVQFDRAHGRVADDERQAVRDHPALAHRRQRRRGQERTADRQADAGGDAAAARPVCHVAYVDVQANPNANELARKAADELARDFKCGKDEVKVIGESGRAVELAKR